MPALPEKGELEALPDTAVLDRLLVLVIDLYEAGDDCRGKVQALATWAGGRRGKGE